MHGHTGMSPWVPYNTTYRLRLNYVEPLTLRPGFAGVFFLGSPPSVAASAAAAAATAVVGCTYMSKQGRDACKEIVEFYGMLGSSSIIYIKNT